MSAAKHTPGPWFVRTHPSLGPFVAAPDCQGRPYDAEILGDDEYHDDEERKLADCHLVAASLELLAAARQAEAWIADQMRERGWPQERIDNPPEGSHLFNLRAAIAKATGGAA